MPARDDPSINLDKEVRLLTELGSDLVYEYRFKPVRGFTYVSPSASRIIGYSPEEHYADPDLGYTILHPDDREQLKDLAGGATSWDVPLRFRWIHKDGHVVWTEQRNRPITDESGEIVGIEGVARDITDAVLAEEALHHNEARLRRINELFSSLGTDPETNIHTIVEETCAVFGAACSLYNVLGDESESLVTWSGSQLPPDYSYNDKPDGHICYEATIKGGTRPVVINDLDGTEYNDSDPNVRAYGLRSYLGFPVIIDGETRGSLCIVDTKTRDFRDADVHIIATLAKGIQLEEQRRSGLRRIEALLEEKEVFLAEMSHRVKNDMALVRSLLALQADQSTGSETREALEEAERRIAVMEQIYARLHATGEVRMVAVDELIHGLVGDLRATTIPGDCMVKLDVDRFSVPTRITVAIGIIINELVTNAVKYAGLSRESCCVGVTVRRAADSVRIVVHDDGLGYPEDVLSGSRSGYGLTIVRALASQYRGSCKLSNGPGATTEIEMRL